MQKSLCDMRVSLNTMLNECKWCGWCGGLGVERAHPNDSGFPCPDCMGTGFQGGKEAERKFDEMISWRAGQHEN